jgi:hypothetical protein
VPTRATTPSILQSRSARPVAIGILLPALTAVILPISAAQRITTRRGATRRATALSSEEPWTLIRQAVWG